MSLSFSLSPRAGIAGVSRRPACHSTLLSGVLVGVLGVGAWAAVPGSDNASPAMVGVAALVTLAAALLSYFLTRGSRRRRARTKETLAWIEKLHLCGSPARTTELATSTNRNAVDSMQSPQVRSLQLHVRTLETVLEEQSTRLAQVRRDIDARQGKDLERVLVAVGALRGRVGDEVNGEQVLDRVEAAVIRLTQPATAARPVLPVRRIHSSGSDSRTLERIDATVPAHPAGHPSPAAASSAPNVADDQTEPLSLPAPALAADDVVLPVPAAHCAAPSRKRRLRRSVA
jgi:hypothetical protein